MRFVLVICIGAMMMMACGLVKGQEAEQAQALAEKGSWAEAIESYGKFLKGLSAEQYRDKKDFSWIVEEYEKSNGKNFAALKTVAEDELAGHPKDAIFTWRLHRMMAGMAEKSGDQETLKKELDLAIASYPAKVEGDPSKHSSLQHLYNQRALLDAAKDLYAAEDFILRAFKMDKRFVYFFDGTWKSWLDENGKAAEYPKLVAKVLADYDEKAKANPGQKKMLQRYAEQLRQMSQS